jgi:hypothetical protein
MTKPINQKPKMKTLRRLFLLFTVLVFAMMNHIVWLIYGSRIISREAGNLRELIDVEIEEMESED